MRALINIDHANFRLVELIFAMNYQSAVSLSALPLLAPDGSWMLVVVCVDGAVTKKVSDQGQAPTTLPIGEYAPLTL